MSKTYRLTTVKGTYYYRRRVPEMFVECLGKKEIKDSLGTKSVKQAQIRRAQKDVEYDALFAQFEKQIATKPNLPIMTEAIAVRLVRDFVDRQDREARKTLAKDAPETEVQRQEMLAEATQDWVSLADPVFLQQHGIDARIFESLVGQVEYRYDQSVFGYAEFYGLVVRALRELARRDISRLKASHGRASYDHLFSGARVSDGQNGAGALVQEPGLTLGRLADQFMEEYSEEAPVRGTSQKTIDGIVVAAEFIKEAMGAELPAQSIDYERCKAFQRLLSRTPANRKKAYPGLSILAAVERAEVEGRRLMAHDTQVTYLRTLTLILKHGVKVGAIAQVWSDGMSPLVEKTKSAEKRRPFTSKELKQIFDAPIYRGCVDDERHYAKPGPNVIRRARYWFPLIALFTGMRANEIAQLHVADLKPLKGGGFYFDVNDEGGKKMKTQASRRSFPVHPELERLGLLIYVEDIRKSGKKSLFPELKKGSYGYMSDRIADWFSDGFLSKVVKKDGRISFHSFRHNFRDALREAEVPDFVLQGLGGWTQSKGVSDNYGSGYKPEQLMKYVQKVAYPELDLGHLYVTP